MHLVTCICGHWVSRNMLWSHAHTHPCMGPNIKWMRGNSIQRRDHSHKDSSRTKPLIHCESFFLLYIIIMSLFNNHNFCYSLIRGFLIRFLFFSWIIPLICHFKTTVIIGKLCVRICVYVCVCILAYYRYGRNSKSSMLVCYSELSCSVFTIPLVKLVNGVKEISCYWNQGMAHWWSEWYKDSTNAVGGYEV